MQIRFLSILFILATSFITSNTFLKQQLTYERVRTAEKEKKQEIVKNLKKFGLTTQKLNIAIIAFKKEALLEIYASTDSKDMKCIATYNICASSGKSGPKRRAGDAQVPEGLYHIDRFNPASNYYLSLGISYPNASDKIRAGANNPGGDIFIHGNCVTIGCLPMTDNLIKEIYLYAVYARNSGQSEIPVYIFPFRMNDENWKYYSEKYVSNKELIAFWKELKPFYSAFNTQKRILKYSVNSMGEYLLNQ